MGKESVVAHAKTRKHTLRKEGDDLEVFAFEADLMLFVGALLVMVHPL